MTYCGKKTSKHGLLISLALVLLSGCGMEVTSEGSSAEAQPQDTSENNLEIAGSAIKGVIQQGLVTANLLVADKDGFYTPHRQAAKSVRTGDDGSYTFRLRGNADDWAHVELVSDSSTRMICDVVPECDQAGSDAVAFGQPMSLGSNFSLRGAGDLGEGNVNLTPLTHLATALAERGANGLSPESLSSAYATVEGWFSLAEGSLRLELPDLTQLDQLDTVSADALQVAIANAAFLALVNDNAQWNTISDVLDNVTAQVSHTGEISILGDGTNVALADLVAAAAIQASDLQIAVDSSTISQKLVVVEYRNVQRFKTIADVDLNLEGDTDSTSDTDDTVADSDTDGSTDTDSGTDDTVADSDTDSTTGSDTDGTTDTGNEETVADTDTDSTNDTADETGTDTDSSTDEVADTETETDSDTTDSTPTETEPANTAMLSWTAPLNRENGESLALSEIAGFEVVYGTSADNLDQSIAVGDPSAEEVLVDELTDGTWYFAVRTLDYNGLRSELSEVVNKQI